LRSFGTVHPDWSSDRLRALTLRRMDVDGGNDRSTLTYGCRMDAGRNAQTILRRGAGPVLHGRIVLLKGSVTLLHLLHGGGWFGDVGWAGFASGTRKRGLRGSAMILVVELLPVAGGLLAYLSLRGDRPRVGLVHRGKLGRAWGHIHAAVAAVVADAVRGARGVVDVVVDHLAVVDVRDVAHVVDGAVVVEVVPAPVTAEVADADVTEAVVNASIEADVGSPVAVMVAIVAAVPAPVGRGPERSIVGRRAPNAGNPVVAVRPPGPVTRCPEIVGVGVRRLIVLGQRRGRLIAFVHSLLPGGLVRGNGVVVAIIGSGVGLGCLFIALALLLRRVGGVLCQRL
jgi:hypothetical protein